MVDKPTKKRRLRATQSMRQAAQQAEDPSEKKPRKLGNIFLVIRWPFKKVAAFLGKYKTMRFIGRILLPRYLRSSWQEIKLVTWPTRRESRRLTFAVIGFAVVFGALVAVLDYGLGHLFKLILLGHGH